MKMKSFVRTSSRGPYFDKLNNDGRHMHTRTNKTQLTLIKRCKKISKMWLGSLNSLTRVLVCYYARHCSLNDMELGQRDGDN